MDADAKSIMKASGVLHAASALRLYALGRRERSQISARTFREFSLAVDHLANMAADIRDGKNEATK